MNQSNSESDLCGIKTEAQNECPLIRNGYSAKVALPQFLEKFWGKTERRLVNSDKYLNFFQKDLITKHRTCKGRVSIQNSKTLGYN